MTTLAGKFISCNVKQTVSFLLRTNTFGIEKRNPFGRAITFSKMLELFKWLGTTNIYKTLPKIITYSFDSDTEWVQ